MIAVALLTLYPGVVGGSETYARELLRALGRVGTQDYRVVLPPVARDAAGGLPSVVVEGYGGRGRLAGMARAVEHLLKDSHHYALCRALGQLGPVHGVAVRDGAGVHERVRVSRGQRAGAVKPVALDAALDWARAFAVDAAVPIDNALVWS